MLHKLVKQFTGQTVYWLREWLYKETDHEKWLMGYKKGEVQHDFTVECTHERAQLQPRTASFSCVHLWGGMARTPLMPRLSISRTESYNCQLKPLHTWRWLMKITS